MAVSRTSWLNKEKLAFLVAGLWLIVVAFDFRHERPRIKPIGKQQVTESRPGRFEVSIDQLARSDRSELKLYSYGLRANPFNVDWRETSVGVFNPPDRPRLKPKSKPVKARPKRPRPKLVKPKAPPPKPTSQPEPTGPEKIAEPPRVPRPYEIPVNLVGWIVVGDQMVAHFRDKSDGALLQVRAGDSLPELDLTVITVARSGVIVEEIETGRRWLLREPVGDEETDGEGAAAESQEDRPDRKPRKSPPGERGRKKKRRKSSSAPGRDKT